MDGAIAGVSARRGLMIAFAAVAAVYVGLVFTSLPSFVVSAVQAVLYVVMPVGAAVAAFVALCRAPQPYRKYWWLIASALTLMALGDAYITWFQTYVGSELTPSFTVGDVAMLAGYLPLIAFVALLVRARLGLASRVVKARFLIDALMAMTIAIYVVIAVIAAQPGQGVAEAGIAGLVNVSYALLDVAVLVGIGIAVLSPSRPHRGSWSMRTFLAMAVMAVADLAYVLVVVGGRYDIGDVGTAVLDIIWMSSYFIFALAAMSFITGDHAIESEHASPMDFSERSRWSDTLPTMAAVVFVPYFMYAARYRATSDLTYWAFADMATWLGCLVVARIAVITVANRQLMSRSVTDPLTGLFNHRFFYDRLEVELSRARRTGESVSVALIDLDDFRVVNDTLGHLAGDLRLRDIAQAISQGARTSDTPCRIGGDEFALIMPATSPLDAFSVSLRITSSLAEIGGPHHVATTASTGIASFPKDASDKVSLVRAADRALYWAKDHGRDQTRVYDPEIGTAEGPRERILRLEEESLLRTVRTLAAAVDARDAHTHSHSHNVAAYSLALGRALGVDEAHARRIEMAALLHDVGKIGVRDSILGKAGELDRFEYEMVCEHPVLGEKILRSTAAQDILPWVLHHHERWDGHGYPTGLAGEAIPFEARIIALCDAYDAMRSDRPYRDGVSEEGALREIASLSGTQFDPDMTGVFVRLVRSGEVASPVEHRNELG